MSYEEDIPNLKGHELQPFAFFRFLFFGKISWLNDILVGGSSSMTYSTMGIKEEVTCNLFMIHKRKTIFNYFYIFKKMFIP